MRSLFFVSKFGVLFIFCFSFLSGNLAAVVTSSETKVCWRDSYGRGVGTIPGQCDLEQEKSGLLCYPKCKSGYKGVGPVCWQSCPKNFKDIGAFCQKPKAYGRGAGYVTRKKCKRKHGDCEKNGLLFYPKCKSGFHNVGCCICSPNCPKGMKDTGTGCTKKSYTRKTILPKCGAKEYDAGLCYKSCRAGYKGVGPVCWGQCPKNLPINCGASCGASKKDCEKSIFDQVFSVGEVIANIGAAIATAGSSAAAQTSGKMAMRTVLKQAAKELGKEFLNMAKDKAISMIKESLKNKNITNPKDLEKAAEQIYAALKDPQGFDPADIDPTGIYNVVKAYNKPICGK